MLALTQEEVKKRINKCNLELISEYKDNRSKISLKCHCGNIFTTKPNSIFSGLTKSCGCLRKQLVSEKFSAKLKHKNFGRLEVICREDNYVGKRKQVRWKCRCKCGNICYVTTGDLNSGHTTSCGCYHNELLSIRSFKGYNEISAQYWTALKNGAKKRNYCFNITIEDGWEIFIKQNRKCALTGIELSFSKNFKNRKLLQTASLDRIDSSKGYEKDNIQWLHKEINTIKWTLSEDKLLYWVEKIYNNRIKK